MNFLVIIAGPTAIGKTSMAIYLAKALDSDIFNADSRQIYKEMNIGTAKPSREELEMVPHHLIDCISIHTPFNAGIYEKTMDGLLDTYFINKRVGVLTGGTGMYIKAIIDGLDHFPPISEYIDTKVESEFNKKGLLYLHEIIQSNDLEYFQSVDINNHSRLLRAAKVILETGKPYSSFLRKKKKELSFTPLFIQLTMDRAKLYERINTRVNQMVNNGLVEESRELYPYRSLKSLQTVGYQELFTYFDGNSSLDEAIELIKRNTRRYAKRQMTWFRNQGDYISFPHDAKTELLDYIKNNISKDTSD